MKMPKKSHEELETEVFDLRQLLVTRYADAERLIAWMDDPKRKPAVTSFTEGNERQIAYRFERLLHGEYICPKCGLRNQHAGGAGCAPDF